MSLQTPPFVHYQVPAHGKRTPRYFVFHTTEGGGSIESLAAFFRGDGGLGVNYITESTGRMGSLGDYEAETWHVKSHNSECIGCEQIGFAAYSREQWFDRHLHQLWAAAWIAAHVHTHFGLPLRYVGHSGRRLSSFNGVPSGFLEHRDVPDNDHDDCGAGYPLGFVLECAEKWVKAGEVPLYVVHGIPRR